MKQSIKLFLMPDYKKILLTLFLTGLSLFFVHTPIYPFDQQPDESGRMVLSDFWLIQRGWPLPYSITHIGFGDAYGYSIFYPGLVINLIFGYFVSCLIIFLYNKLKNKKV